MTADYLGQVMNNHVGTYQVDGRKRIEDIYSCYLKLLNTDSWNVEKIADSKTVWLGKNISFPVLAFKTKIRGPAIYIISGIHGEEPSGPGAIAESIEILNGLGQKRPAVLIPLCNPLGYLRNWRYLNEEKYTDFDGEKAQSVGDSDHFLLDPDDKTKPRNYKPSNDMCLTLSKYILRSSQEYPPSISLNFHEDDLIPKGYIYSHGVNGEKEELASQILKVLENNGIPIQQEGKTRFGEDIVEGKIDRPKDGSIDELISAMKIIVDGKTVFGPKAEKVLVLEIPSANIQTEKRVKAYKAVISFISDLETSKISL